MVPRPWTAAAPKIRAVQEQPRCAQSSMQASARVHPCSGYAARSPTQHAGRTGRDTKRTGQAVCEFGALTVQVVCLGMDGGSKQMRTGSGSALEPNEGDFCLARFLCLPVEKWGEVRISGFGSRMLTKGNRRRGSGLWPRVSLPDCGIFRFACIFDRPRAPPPFPARARHRYL